MRDEDVVRIEERIAALEKSVGIGESGKETLFGRLERNIKEVDDLLAEIPAFTSLYEKHIQFIQARRQIDCSFTSYEISGGDIALYKKEVFDPLLVHLEYIQGQMELLDVAEEVYEPYDALEKQVKSSLVALKEYSPGFIHHLQQVDQLLLEVHQSMRKFNVCLLQSQPLTPPS